jgi:hypothetical protein
MRLTAKQASLRLRSFFLHPALLIDLAIFMLPFYWIIVSSLQTKDGIDEIKLNRCQESALKATLVGSSIRYSRCQPGCRLNQKQEYPSCNQSKRPV